MSNATVSLNRPWHVRTTGGTFHSGYLTEDGAYAAVDTANKKAIALGIQTRYEMVPNAEGSE